MKKGQKIKVSNLMSEEAISYWKLNKDEVYTLTKNEFFANGEGQVKTDKGSWPSIFFEKMNDDSNEHLLFNGERSN